MMAQYPLYIGHWTTPTSYTTTTGNLNLDAFTFTPLKPPLCECSGKPHVLHGPFCREEPAACQR